jgi:hypothetical protein
VLDLTSASGEALGSDPRVPGDRSRILLSVPPHARIAAALALVAIVVGGCNGGGAASPSGSPPADVSPAASPAASSCRPTELRTPSGDLIDLTGTWFGVDDQTYYSFLQIGRCVWASSTGGPHVFDQARLCCQELVLHGTVASDFTIAVDFAYVPLECEVSLTPCRGEVGTATLKIEIESGPDGEVLTLRKVGGASALERASNLGVTLWTRVARDLISPSPTPGS